MVITAKFNRQLAKGLMASVAVASLVLSGCSSDSSETKGTPRVVVFGDSLVDVGTFGYKYTTQGSAPTGPVSNKVLPEVIAASLGANQPCAYFRSNDEGTSYEPPTTGCTGFGVGGGRILHPLATSPKSLPVQFDAAASAIGSYTNDDVVVISISGNDGADLIVDYLAFALGSPTNFITRTKGILGDATVTALRNADPTGATIGIAYMTALATKTYELVQTKLLNRGANKVLLANSPKLSVTPRLAIGLAQQTTPQREQLVVLFDTWVKSYNEQLAVKFAPEPRVAIFDLYGLMDTSATTPATYGFTNSRDASCPPTITSSGPTYDVKNCTEARANGYITSGQPGLISKSPLNGNFTGFLYSDDFHPTPKGHEVAGQLALELIKSKDWATR
jgi:phospholipase/lecithinase/hemolysin